MVQTYDLTKNDPALGRLALIVRGADTQRHDLTPESRGLLAMAQGFSEVYVNDEQQLAAEMPVGDVHSRLVVYVSERTLPQCPEGSGVLYTDAEPASYWSSGRVLSRHCLRGTLFVNGSATAGLL